jgi:hypothetical protein
MTAHNRKRSLVWLALPVAVLVAGAAHRVADSRQARRTFEFAEGELREVRVDTLWGEIVVLGHDESNVSLEVTETVRGDSAADIERARREVELQIDSSEGVLDLFVDGPFRCKDDRNRWSDHADPAYEVIYAFDLRVPRATSLDLRTVGEGDIRVEGVHGGFQLSNVTGALDLRGLRGAGEAHTVSAPIIAVFDRPPAGPVRFETVSQDIQLFVPAETAADLLFRSRWGDVWTDLALGRVEPPPPAFERHGDKLVMRAEVGPVARLGAGGPMITLESLSGDVYLRDAASAP